LAHTTRTQHGGYLYHHTTQPNNPADRAYVAFRQWTTIHLHDRDASLKTGKALLVLQYDWTCLEEEEEEILLWDQTLMPLFQNRFLHQTAGLDSVNFTRGRGWRRTDL